MSKRDWGANQFLSKPLCFEGSTNHGVMYVVLSIKVLKFCNLLLLNVIIQILCGCKFTHLWKEKSGVIGLLHEHGYSTLFIFSEFNPIQRSVNLGTALPLFILKPFGLNK